MEAVVSRSQQLAEAAWRDTYTMKVVSIFGARPQFIKAALVSRQLRCCEVQEITINTGQHYDAFMSDIFLRELQMTVPHYNLGVGSATHAVQTARILEGTEEVLTQERPDAVIVYGDTNSTLAGSLAAAKLHIPVVHVEAGLRSFNRRMPEELNRIVTDHLSDLLLAPSEAAAAQLSYEGIPESKVSVVGDIMFDAVLAHLDLASRSTVLRRLSQSAQGYVLCTVHRAENTDDPKRLSIIMQALSRVASRLPVVLPVHPRLRNAMQSSGLGTRHDERLLFIDPVGYLDMLALERNAAVVATDSGGVQKEAFFVGVPCVTLRNETEWRELIDAGWNVLAPPDGSVNVARMILAAVGMKGLPGVQPYGDGSAAKKICSAVTALCASAQPSLERVM
jgi:UDP-GlcNAc3NAcA epimerase